MSYADNKRIIKNTIFLYIRTFVSMIVALYTSRKILEVLGVEDFGIFNVVGGIISLMAFINGSMSVATQRYLTYLSFSIKYTYNPDSSVPPMLICVTLLSFNDGSYTVNIK